MPESFKRKELTVGEKKWGFIQIPMEHLDFFPLDNKKFIISVKDKKFKVSISKAVRIVKKDLVKKLASSKHNELIITKKGEREFQISVN
jgi:hypothetical protein